MENRKVSLRIAEKNDAAELLNIYAPYVLETAITFEYEVPSVREFEDRITATLTSYPYIVAEIDGNIVGYAYTGEFKSRAAYMWSVETSIYVDRSIHRAGVGKLLYKAIERISAAQNVVNLNACIAYPDEDDIYLDKNSVRFHEHIGYTLVGEFHKCAYKFNNWYNMVWMEKLIDEHTANQKPFVKFSELDADIIEKALSAVSL